MEVVQVKIVDGVKFVEVLDAACMDRHFRVVWRDVDIRVGDQLWWQLFDGMLTRAGEFEDRAIGRCEPSDALVVDPEFAKEYEKRFRPIHITTGITESEKKRKMSDSEKTSNAEDFGSSDCYVAANRLLLGQYRVQTTGKDAELVAKDRYDVAAALIRQRDRIKEIAGVLEDVEARTPEDAHLLFNVINILEDLAT